MHHMMRADTRADMIETEIRVARFEISKQKSNSAMKKITILSTRERFHEHEPRKKLEMTYDHISNAHGRLRIIAIGSRPKAG
jgi:hypothetical protein